MLELPELAEGWYWNAIDERVGATVKDGIAREYVVSASRRRGLPKKHSATVYVSIQMDTKQELRDLFNTAFEWVANATKTPSPDQDKLDVLAEVLDGFEDERMQVATQIWIRDFKANEPGKTYIIGDD